MIITTTPQTGYVVTAVSVPLEIKAVVDGTEPVTLLLVNTPGQYAFIAPSEQIEISQDDADIVPNPAVTITANQYELPLATSNSLGGVLLGKSITLDENGRLIYNLNPATTTELGGIKAGDNLEISVDGTLTTSANVFLTDQDNSITGKANFTQSVAVGDARNDEDALNTRSIFSILNSRTLPKPLSLRYKAGTCTLISAGHVTILSEDSTRCPQLYWNEANVDAWGQYTYFLPLNLAKSAEAFLSMGYETYWDSSNPRPKPGEVINKSLYQCRACTVFPKTAWPDMQTRIQASSSNYTLARQHVMGYCIVPNNSIALVWIKIDQHNTDWARLERRGCAGIFSLDNAGNLTHLVNACAQSLDNNNWDHGTNGNHGFFIGKTAEKVDWDSLSGLSSQAKIFNSNILKLTHQDYTVKASYVFDQSIHDVGIEGGTVVSQWREKGIVTPSATYPSSDWLDMAVNGNEVTISVAPNETGNSRMGVANLEASVNGITYTIVIYQF